MLATCLANKHAGAKQQPTYTKMNLPSNISLTMLPALALATTADKAVAQNNDTRYPKCPELATVPVNAAAQATAVRPNILYIMCDDHSMQTISAYGSALSKLAPTPNIDRLARRGMLFRSAFVENSLSTPSRACLITGLYSHQNGQRQLGEGIDTTRTFFSELLQKAGYTTAMVGKWHMHCRPKGFDFFHILYNQGSYYNPVFCSNREYGKYKQEKGYATTLITDHAINFLEHRDKSKPFCLLVHHKAPHRNWMPEEKYFGLYSDVEFPLPKTFWDDYATRGSAARTQKMRIDDDLRMIQDLKVPETLDTADVESMDSYYALLGETSRFTTEQRVAFDKYYMPRNKKFIESKLTGKELVKWKYQNYIRDYAAVIRSVDDNVGRLLDYLEQNGLSDNTIVVYTSDQGFYMGEHGWFDKRFMYEESFHTPLIISYPGHVKEGTECNQLVQNIDFAPTFLELAGVKKPTEMSGLSLQPLFKGRTGEKTFTTIITTIQPTTLCVNMMACATNATSLSTSTARAATAPCKKTSTNAHPELANIIRIRH